MNTVMILSQMANKIMVIGGMQRQHFYLYHHLYVLEIEG